MYTNKELKKLKNALIKILQDSYGSPEIIDDGEFLNIKAEGECEEITITIQRKSM